MIASRGDTTGATGAWPRGEPTPATVGAVTAPTDCHADYAANAVNIRTDELSADPGALISDSLGGAGVPVVAHIGKLAMLVTIGPLGNRRRAAEMEIIFAGLAERPLAGRAVIFNHGGGR